VKNPWDLAQVANVNGYTVIGKGLGAFLHPPSSTETSSRFIPNRSGQDLQASFSLLHDEGSPATPSRANKRTPNELHFQRSECLPHLNAVGFTNMLGKAEEANRTYSTLLRSEMFESSVPQSLPQNLSPTLPINHGTTFHDPSRSNTPPIKPLPAPTMTPSTPHKNLFSYMSPRHHVSYSGHLTPSRTPHSRHGPNLNARAEIYSLSPIKQGSQMMLLSPRKTPRAVPKVPYKVLDAPDLADDFYLNLVDWGSQNILGVGLGQCVYMWNSASGRVTKLCELPDDTVTSVNWIQRVSSLG